MVEPFMYLIGRYYSTH